MPCDMMRGYTTGDSALSSAGEAHKRISEIEQALCGLCQQFEAAGAPLHPQLAAWFANHKKMPGCVAETPEAKTIAQAVVAPNTLAVTVDVPPAVGEVVSFQFADGRTVAARVTGVNTSAPGRHRVMLEQIP